MPRRVLTGEAAIRYAELLFQNQQAAVEADARADTGDNITLDLPRPDVVVDAVTEEVAPVVSAGRAYLRRLASRKFLMAAAAFLTSVGGRNPLAAAGVAAIYVLAEAHVDARREGVGRCG